MTTTISPTGRPRTGDVEADEPGPAAIPRPRLRLVLPAMLVLVVVSGALRIASGLALDPVRDELRSQQITFPPSHVLVADGRGDLASYGGALVDTGPEAKAFAGYISGHLHEIGGGKTYAELGGPERAAFAELQEAIAADAPQSRIDELRAIHAPLKGQRDTIFQGQMLRGSLLNAYGWWTVGQTALLASWAALALAVIIGGVELVRRWRRRHAATPAIATA